MKTRGLVLGKFAPFHRGHESLVRRALAETEEAVVLVYDAPETTSIPLAVRAGWVREIFPMARVIEGHGAPSESGRAPRIQRLQEDYLQRVVPAPITHFYSSEWYGDHVARALDARDVRVDESRSVVPVSGTAIRADPAAHRHHIDPRVYFDLLHRVALLGAESTGKSTLAAALARRLATAHVPEFGRDYWAEHKGEDGRLTSAQLVELARGHRASEVAHGRMAERLLVVDTDARTTRQYARWWHGRVDPALDAMAGACYERYDLTILCGDEFDYVEDGTRAGAERRRAAQAEIRTELATTGAPWIEVTGDVGRRIDTVTAEIARRRLDRFRR